MNVADIEVVLEGGKLGVASPLFCLKFVNENCVRIGFLVLTNRARVAFYHHYCCECFINIIGLLLWML
jgi:hypothetical protein